jgi:hypothetical protein
MTGQLEFVVRLQDEEHSILYSGPSLELAMAHARAWMLEPMGVAVVVECT